MNVKCVCVCVVILSQDPHQVRRFSVRGWEQLEAAQEHRCVIKEGLEEGQLLQVFLFFGKLRRASPKQRNQEEEVEEEEEKEVEEEEEEGGKEDEE